MGLNSYSFLSRGLQFGPIIQPLRKSCFTHFFSSFMVVYDGKVNLGPFMLSCLEVKVATVVSINSGALSLCCHYFPYKLGVSKSQIMASLKQL